MDVACTTYASAKQLEASAWCNVFSASSVKEAMGGDEIGIGLILCGIEDVAQSSKARERGQNEKDEEREQRHRQSIIDPGCQSTPPPNPLSLKRHDQATYSPRASYRRVAFWY
jgi:hypothetical protein